MREQAPINVKLRLTLLQIIKKIIRFVNEDYDPPLPPAGGEIERGGTT